MSRTDATKLGSSEFRCDYGLKYACAAGAMARLISSPALLESMAESGTMGSLGIGGLSDTAAAAAIDETEARLGSKSFMVDILAGPGGAARRQTIELCLKKGVTAIEASAFMNADDGLVLFRLSGAVRRPDGTIEVPHRIMAKVSREETAQKFLSPPESAAVGRLLEAGLIQRDEAELSPFIPAASDITVEGDSGGHTDQRPLLCVFPAVKVLRDRLCEKYGYTRRVRIGAAGGISTGESALAAFVMGADYIMTGSVNQSCTEAGTSEYVKELLCTLGTGDVMTAPCADMFESGAKVQVVRKGTLYPQNAAKLYELYKTYGSWEEIPGIERSRVEKRIFRRSFDEVMAETESFFESVSPETALKAREDSRLRLALAFRWYLGSSSRWAVEGNTDRRTDMQIWCGPAIGAFNRAAAGTPFEKAGGRHAGEVNEYIMNEAARLLDEAVGRVKD